METSWDRLWRREEEFFLSGKPEFRHNADFIAVSSIAEQFYCEYKVENEFALGKIPTEAKNQGTDIHDELIPRVPVEKEKFVKLVSGKQPSYAVLRVWGTVGGLRIVGMPDHIVWMAGRPKWLVELKTTKGDPSFLWPDQEAQIRIYGLLLDLMGFDCSRMRLALVRLRAGELTEHERRTWIERVSVNLESGKIRELEAKSKGSMKVHLLAHTRAAGVAAIMEKRGYWIGEREPTSSTSVGKCRACEYNSVCPKSLYKSLGESSS
ncbi:MAG: hypothetical protein HY297_05930 [Thaumarchaeota archaeon]|nr:hypothetical protein [Nitrososphaerota archaeon]